MAPEKGNNYGVMTLTPPLSLEREREIIGKIMIVKMKKITILVTEKDKDNFVSEIKKAGVVHIKHVNPPVGHEVRFEEDRIDRVEKMIFMLEPFAEKDRQTELKGDRRKEFLEYAHKVEQAFADKQELEEEIRLLENKLLWFEPWGKFNPDDIALLANNNVTIRLYCVTGAEFKKNDLGSKCHVIGRNRGRVYLVLITMDPEEQLSFDEVKFPKERPEELFNRIELFRKKIGVLDELLKEKAKYLNEAERCKERLEQEKKVLEVKCGMQGEGNFTYMQGYCPVDSVNKIVDMAKAKGLGYIFEEPVDPDDTPTLIKNPAWVRIISPVFQFMNTLPGYKEFDISFVFMVFFSLFFAMLIGDAGYGSIFLVATFLIRRKFKKLPREPFFLMYLLSVSTIIWGAITGTWFGVERIAEAPFFRSLVINRISSFGEGSQQVLIYLCFLIGAVHLTIARLTRAVRLINSLTALAEIGWVFIIWGMFFAAGKFVLGKPFPGFAGWYLISGILLVLFFANIQKGILKGMAATMTSLPLNVISSFSDVVSYLRLFAVGYATVVMAESFNNMAVGSGIDSILSGVAAAFILFIGHTLNIMLGFMAVIVHGIRLNMLEFSGHLGMQWSGKKYEPFR